MVSSESRLQGLLEQAEEEAERLLEEREALWARLADARKELDRERVDREVERRRRDQGMSRVISAYFDSQRRCDVQAARYSAQAQEWDDREANYLFEIAEIRSRLSDAEADRDALWDRCRTAEAKLEM